MVKEYMKRHIAKLRNTDQRVVVLFMQIPDRSDHALVAPMENLSSHVEQLLMEIVESAEGQADPTLANVLGRRLVGNTGKSMLQVLHESQLLRAVHIDQVIMYPQPNMPFPLRDIIEKIGPNTLPPPSDETLEANEKFNPHNNNAAARAVEERLAIAKNLLAEAEDLQDAATRKRQDAYRIAPELSQATAKAAESQSAEDEAETLTVTTKRTRGRPKKANPTPDA
jgi:hypothetical protein